MVLRSKVFDWQIEKKMLNLHVINTTHLTKLFLKDMVKKNNGKILNISSIAAFQPGPLMALYYATKAYILHFTEAISNEVKDKNITISVLCPGQTNTNFQRNVSSIKNKIKFNTASPIKVAKYGYDALNNNVTVSIPGTFNKLLVNLNRFLPRSLSTNIVNNAFSVDIKQSSFLVVILLHATTVNFYNNKLTISIA